MGNKRWSLVVLSLVLGVILVTVQPGSASGDGWTGGDWGGGGGCCNGTQTLVCGSGSSGDSKETLLEKIRCGAEDCVTDCPEVDACRTPSPEELDCGMACYEAYRLLVTLLDCGAGGLCEACEVSKATCCSTRMELQRTLNALYAQTDRFACCSDRDAWVAAFQKSRCAQEDDCGMDKCPCGRSGCSCTNP